MERITILGGGESGVGAAILAKKKGIKVFLSDSGSLSKKYKEELNFNKIPFEEKGHTFERIINADVVIKSPGVPSDCEPCRVLRDQGIEIISEIEFGSYFFKGKIIAITGSNGKTTTSGLIHHIMANAGLHTALGGNYGTSMCRILAAEDQPEYLVLELSSFQLDDIKDFKPDIAILLNITPDHLDRYGYDIMKYGAAKLRIIENQSSLDVFIYNGDDKITNDLLKGKTLPMKLVRILDKEYINGIYSKELDANFEINLIGKHNLFNAICAVQAAREVGINDDKINLGLKSFRNVPHRMETTASINGVTYINDSKATNVDAVYYALEGIRQSVIWIAGGTDKGNDYTILHQLVKDKVKALICLGLDNSKLRSAFHSVIDHIVETDNMVDAIKMATDYAERGEVVLLSPACASFDLFKNYIDRGDQFKAAVWQLIE